MDHGREAIDHTPGTKRSATQKRGAQHRRPCNAADTPRDPRNLTLKSHSQEDPWNTHG